MKKWILWALVAGAIGCGDDTQPAADAAVPDGQIDAPAIDAPMMDAFGSNCATLMLPATVVVQMDVAEAPPTPTGGTFAPGTYVVTADVFYTGDGGTSGATGTTLKASGTTQGNPGGDYQYISLVMNQGQATLSVTSGHYSVTDGSAIDITQVCPQAAGINFTSYSATANSFTLYAPGLGTTEALTFTKQ